MKYADHMPQFSYHPRCANLELTHLCFANDLMFFCNEEYRSVNYLMHGLETFSLSSGLKANSDKSAIYFGNVKDTTKKNILEVTGFVEGKLPFKYLGVPITAKKLSGYWGTNMQPMCNL